MMRTVRFAICNVSANFEQVVPEQYQVCASRAMSVPGAIANDGAQQERSANRLWQREADQLRFRLLSLTP
jgi:hypothetical protein